MVLDFDLETFCENLRATKPPYVCPVPECGRVFKSYNGIQSHMTVHEEEDRRFKERLGTAAAKDAACGRKFADSPGTCSRIGLCRQMDVLPCRRNKDRLTFAEAQRFVDLDIGGRASRIDVTIPLEVIGRRELDSWNEVDREALVVSDAISLAVSGEGIVNVGASNQKSTHKESQKLTSLGVDNKLPEPSFRTLDKYAVPPNVGSPRPKKAYYRFIERSTDELDDSVEYDMDEEDCVWLTLVNKRRKKLSLPTVSSDTFEMVMDRLEKEAFFLGASSSKRRVSGTTVPDEEAVCAVCLDGECQNVNMILFCDSCNLAVHQECYGVPFVPEGQWLCRRCLQSPGRIVDCALCPNKGGAFKQAEDGRWAHVACALWIPEVTFANVTFLEPICGLGRIPPARWKLTCYICKQQQQSAGACIQCHKPSCYVAFHVTCAQQAGLYMKIEPIRDANGQLVNVRKTAFCDGHSPVDSASQPIIDNVSDDEEDDVGDRRKRVLSPGALKAKARERIRRARKILAERRNSVEEVPVLIIPPHRLAPIAETLPVGGKVQFMNLVVGYWTLKRQSRNGCPLIRRLQTGHSTTSSPEQLKKEDEMFVLLRCGKKLRQEMEKVRLLLELIRKREKLKRELMAKHIAVVELQLAPFKILLHKTLDELEKKDPYSIFAEPVPLDKAPRYLEFVKQPMDFSTIRSKIDGHRYKTFEDFVADFNLIIKNCLTYNTADTIFYRAAIRLRKKGAAIITTARKSVEAVGFEASTGLHVDRSMKKGLLNSTSKLPKQEAKSSASKGVPLDTLKASRPIAKPLSPTKPTDVTKAVSGTGLRRRLALLNGFNVSDCASKTVAQAPSAMVVKDRKRKLDQIELPGEGVDASSPVREVSPKREKLDKGELRTQSEVVDGNKVGRKSEGYRFHISKKELSSLGLVPKTVQSPNNITQSATKFSPWRQRAHALMNGGVVPAKMTRRTEMMLTDRDKRYVNRNIHLMESVADSKENDVREITVSFNDKGGRGSMVVNDRSKKWVPMTKNNFVGYNGLEAPKKFCDKSGICRPRQESPSVDGVSATTAEGVRRCENSSVKERRDEECSESADERDEGACSNGIKFVTDGECNGSASNASSHCQTEAEGTAVRSLDGKARAARGSHQRIVEAMVERFIEDGRLHRYKQCIRALAEGRPLDSLPAEIENGTLDAKEGDRAVALNECQTENGNDRYVPLEMVWAKCSGHPWFPALVINPTLKRTYYTPKGVPIPAPPRDVAAMQKKMDKEYADYYLVLFFDAKKTWQWLAPGKLELLGCHFDSDVSKLSENRRGNVVRSVLKAYERAVAHCYYVIGEPNHVVKDPDMVGD